MSWRTPDRGTGPLRPALPSRRRPAWLDAAIEWAGLAALLVVSCAIGATWAIVMEAPASAERPGSP